MLLRWAPYTHESPALAKDGAYGSAEKSVFVRQPLMLLATLPRVVGPGEELTVPERLRESYG
jgi:hypothetical protein